MKNIIIVIITFLTVTQIRCQSASAETSDVKRVEIKTAPNVSIGPESVWAYYPTAEFVVSYCGEANFEIENRSNIFEAQIIQTEPGIWFAKSPNGDYIKINTITGVTNMEINGEFRVFAKN